MSLQFYFGASGSGKSYQLQQDMLKLAEQEKDRNILFLVPDQFTMQTQFDLVAASRQKGIMNIDVLSFGRLSHRIFEETGMGHMTVLDDTGKSLVLRLIASRLEKKLPVIGPNLHRLGYIQEVKSAISEFMQYGISPEEVLKLSEYAKGRGMLHDKLLDLERLYSEFLKEIEERFVTTEETLELLTKAVEKSDIIKDSVIVFDGFTGFTPIQNRLIQRLMELTDKVIVSVTLDMKEDPFTEKGDQELFHLSKKTVRDLCRLAEEAGATRNKDVFIREEVPYRFLHNPCLAHLEKNLFRYPVKVYEEPNRAISIFEARDLAQETREVCRQVKELVLTGEYCYRDIAIVAGNLEAYGDYLERESAVYEIPMFMDRTRGLLLNPFIELIRSSLKILLSDFSYESVFHFLRSGMTDFTEEEVDRLENYVLALGIKGKRKWSQPFVRRMKGTDEEKQLLYLEELNASREKLLGKLEVLMVKKRTAGEYIRCLYEFLMTEKCEERLLAYQTLFEQQGNMEKAKEYGQVYRLIMELFEQIAALIPEEQLTLKEFAELLDAGFGEIEIGIIPGSVDRVVAGDIERTRLKQVKVLFFLGVNDGNIPKGNGNGGIISDIDREFLQESEFELAPSPRQQMYIQRLYLYMNLTKPSEKLCLSYSRVGKDGKSIRPSYLIDMIRRLFGKVLIQRLDEEKSRMDQISGFKDGLPVLTESLRAYRDGRLKEKAETEQLRALLALYREKEEYQQTTEKILEAAFLQYSHSPLSKAVAAAVYGSLLENSVSRLEKYAACAYAHFLQYGLTLKEREEFSFEVVDLGNIFHMVLERFAGKLAENKLTWFDFDEETGNRLLDEALKDCVADYGDTILYSTARYEYQIEKIFRILKRTIKTLQSQLRGGAFTPAHFEMSFSRVQDFDGVNIALSDQEKMRLKGRIDRVDTYEDADHVYVKVVDYKSGNKKFDLAALYYGLQLQLVVYMNVAEEMEKRKHPDKEIVPAALLYYHVADPLIKEEGELSAEEIETRLLKELRTTGVVNGREPVVDLLDREMTDKSLLIPVERNKNGSYSASSSILSQEDYKTVSDFVNRKIKAFGQEILNGNIAISPCSLGKNMACTYCSYKGICDFDEKIAGFEVRELAKYPEEEILQKMKEE